MRKYLSIIIPRYGESEKDVFPLLSGISGQVGIDFSDIEVIVANDGGGAGELDGNFLSLFGFDSKQVNLDENRGPGVARQAGLDAAKGEYVMFCDADDCLHNVGVLGAMMQEAEKNAPDIIRTSWLEEGLDASGQYVYITHEQENTWMHGKFLRRHFLVQNGVRFHGDLRVHEDSYFLCIASALAQRNVYLPITSYVWKYRPESITRRNNGAYSFDSIPEFIRACTMGFGEIESRATKEQMEYNIVQFTLYNYFSFHSPGWLDPARAGILQTSEKAFAKHIAPFWHYWQEASPESVGKIYGQEREKLFNGCVEDETVWKWIERIRRDDDFVSG